ncbi:MAG: ATPase [Pseudomonadota bacterium]
MRMSANQFQNWSQKAITLLGMSGVGKTVLANKLRRENWYHYSGDYRIGSRYLDEPIMDNIKKHAMTVPLLRELLRSDSITISNKITFENLKPLSIFLSKIGDPNLNGLTLEEFSRRQDLHRRGEIKSMLDVPKFIERARNVYAYDHFVNDAGGSVCELDDADVIECLAQHTMIIYLKATKADEEQLVARQIQEPKPMYYRPAFLKQQLPQYLREKGLSSTDEIEPDDFVRWIFPKLFYERIPRYEKIAADFGYTITTDELASVTGASDFLKLLETKL